MHDIIELQLPELPFRKLETVHRRQLPFFALYLLYLDESGNESDPADRHFVLAGAAVFERQTYFLAQQVEKVQDRHFPLLPPVTFHATDMRTGKGKFWRSVERSKRDGIVQEIAEVIGQAHDPGVVLFGAVIEKSRDIYGPTAVEHATEQVCKRFDTFLARSYHEHHNPQRGLIIFSEGRFDKRAKVWVRGFRNLGTQWGVLNNLADIPYFAAGAENRLLQVADFVAHGLYLLYERRDPSLIKHFLHRFDQKDGVMHGLVHRRALNLDTVCECPACSSRRQPSHSGSWI